MQVVGCIVLVNWLGHKIIESSVIVEGVSLVMVNRIIESFHGYILDIIKVFN